MLFGTSDWQIVVMSATGAMLAQVTVCDGREISSMAWSCQRFFLEDPDTQSRDNCDSDSTSKCFIRFSDDMIPVL